MGWINQFYFLKNSSFSDEAIYDFQFYLFFLIKEIHAQSQYAECKDNRESPRRSSKDVESENVSSSGQTTKIAIDTGTESSTEWNTRNSSLRKIENTPIRDTGSVLEKIGEFHKVKLTSIDSFHFNSISKHSVLKLNKNILKKSYHRIFSMIETWHKKPTILLSIFYKFQQK